MTPRPLTAEERANDLMPVCDICDGRGHGCNACNNQGVIYPSRQHIIEQLETHAAQETAALRAERDELKAVVEKLRKHSEELAELAAERIRSLQRIIDEAWKHIDKASAAHEAAEAARKKTEQAAHTS